MARVIALAHSFDRDMQLELLRGLIVIACASALIAAGDMLPGLL